MKEIALDVNPKWLDYLNYYYVNSAMVIMACMIPLLLFSFGGLYVYYNYCHPWVSEGISLGFEPIALDEGFHTSFGSSEQSEGKTIIFLHISLLQILTSHYGYSLESNVKKISNF